MIQTFYSAQPPHSVPNIRFVGIPRGSRTWGPVTPQLERHGGLVFETPPSLGSVTVGASQSSIEPETRDAFLVLGGRWADEHFFALISAQEPERVRLHSLVQQLPRATLDAACQALSAILADAMTATLAAPASVAELYESTPRRQIPLRRK